MTVSCLPASSLSPSSTKASHSSRVSAIRPPFQRANDRPKQLQCQLLQLLQKPSVWRCLRPHADDVSQGGLQRHPLVLYQIVGCDDSTVGEREMPAEQVNAPGFFRLACVVPESMISQPATTIIEAGEGGGVVGGETVVSPRRWPPSPCGKVLAPMLSTSVMEFDVMNCLDDAAEHGPRYSDGIMNETGLWGWRCPICVVDSRKIQCRALLKSSTGNQTYHTSRRTYPCTVYDNNSLLNVFSFVGR